MPKLGVAFYFLLTQNKLLMNKIFVYAICFTLFGCSAYTIKKYHLENKFEYKDKKSFLVYLKNKNIFSESQYLYLDSGTYIKFIYEKVQQDSSAIYQGCYINDSVLINRSRFLNENASCGSRIEKEIASNFLLKNFPDSILLKENKMSDYKIKYLINDEPFDINKNKKDVTLFFLYSSAFGTYYDNLFKKINKLHLSLKNSTQVYVICIDPIYHLK